MSFFKKRGLLLAAVVLIMAIISLTQDSISYTIAYGALRRFEETSLSLIGTILVFLRFALFALLVVLWIQNRKRALFRGIIISNTLLTLGLLLHTYSLLAVLAGISSHAVDVLIVDVVLMAVSNVLIFSIWYWFTTTAQSGLRDRTGGCQKDLAERSAGHTLFTRPLPPAGHATEA